jgi:hypothetical protein
LGLWGHHPSLGHAPNHHTFCIVLEHFTFFQHFSTFELLVAPPICGTPPKYIVYFLAISIEHQQSLHTPAPAPVLASHHHTPCPCFKTPSHHFVLHQSPHTDRSPPIHTCSTSIQAACTEAAAGLQVGTSKQLLSSRSAHRLHLHLPPTLACLPPG